MWFLSQRPAARAICWTTRRPRILLELPAGPHRSSSSLLLLQLLGLPSPQLVYIESWARVRSLSLTARLLRPFVDRFVVQWPDAAGPLRDGEECRGWLV